MTIAKLNDLGQEIFMSRYAYPGEKEWRQRAKAIARTVAGAEPDEDKGQLILHEQPRYPAGRTSCPQL